MTRINVLPVELLNDKHLGAEYRELPRVFGFVRKKVQDGFIPTDIRIPNSYRLGEGHVTFFYDKLGFLINRYQAICVECRNRGRQVNYGDISGLTVGIPDCWFGRWDVTPKAIAANLERVIDQGGLRYGAVPSMSLVIPLMKL